MAEHRHAGAPSGFKDAEFSGSGHNRLVFDDSPGQLRTQVATTQAASELSLGHLIHQEDNYRGSGFELRTQAYAAERGARDVLINTWRKAQGTPQGPPRRPALPAQPAVSLPCYAMPLPSHKPCIRSAPTTKGWGSVPMPG